MAALSVNEINAMIDKLCDTMQILKNETTPKFITEVLTLFCNDGERAVRELTTLLEQPTVDLVEVDTLVHQLKGCSGWVGAQKVQDACVEFRAFCKKKDRDGCLKTLETIKTEFYDARGKFQTILKHLEGRIIGFQLK